MVGRSKPQKQMESAITDDEDFVTAENTFLKMKNTELAKALAEAKITMKQIADERDYYQRQVLTIHMKNSELLNYIKTIDDAARESINAIVLSSNYIAEIKRAVTLAKLRKSDTILPSNSLHESFNNQQTKSSPSGKMHAVRPMVDGHVIYRPIINLRRVNEIPHEQVQAPQSTPEVLGEIGNNLTSNQDNVANVSNFRYHSTSATTSMSFNDHSNHTPVNGLDDDDDDEEEYVPSSSNVPESERINSRSNYVYFISLHTIEEFSENIGSSSNLEETPSTLASPGTNPISIPSHNAQVPLLSGVFRDVRVYLSPMQNISQYLESLQGLTTESRKQPNVQKKNYLPRTVSLDENNPCVFSSYLDGSSNSNLPSANTSFEDANNSILTSTRIGSNFEESFRGRNSDFVNKCRRPNNFDNTTVNKKANWNDTSERCDNSRCTQVKDGCIKGESFSPSSFQTPTTVSTAYDPLEGPSSLLDSTTSERDKLEALSILGLKPKVSTESLSTSPSSPAFSVLKRRERANKNNTHQNQNKSIYITKRKLDSKKKCVVSSKVVKRLSNSPLKILKIKRSLNSSDETVVNQSNSSVENSGKLVKKKIKLKVEPKQELNTPESSTLSLGSTPSSSISVSNSNKPIKKRKKILNLNEVMPKKKKSISPQKSPKKKRHAVLNKKSLKEPSLLRKMRRS